VKKRRCASRRVTRAEASQHGSSAASGGHASDGAGHVRIGGGERNRRKGRRRYSPRVLWELLWELLEEKQCSPPSYNPLLRCLPGSPGDSLMKPMMLKHAILQRIFHF
jgi:hypothetical protein